MEFVTNSAFAQQILNSPPHWLD